MLSFIVFNSIDVKFVFFFICQLYCPHVHGLEDFSFIIFNSIKVEFGFFISFSCTVHTCMGRKRVKELRDLPIEPLFSGMNPACFLGMYRHSANDVNWPDSRNEFWCQ